MEEEAKRETRRSRSKTPLTLRSSVDRDVVADGEKGKKPVKKLPAVETISEEKESPVVPAQRAQRQKRVKVITSDYSSDGSVDSSAVNKDTAALIASSVAAVPLALTANEKVTTVTTKTTTTTITKKSSKGAAEEVKSAITSSTTKAKRASQRESDQNESNILLEKNLKLRTSTPRQANAAAHALPNFNESSKTNGVNLEEHVPFKEYRDAGEYWNKFPKTDYTYSRLSRQRREIKPGVLAMPNMSRRSLELHHERVNQMIQRDPNQESFFRSRFLASRRSAPNFSYDSSDELDLSQFDRNTSYTAQSVNWVRRLFTTIITIFTSIWTRTTSVFRRQQTNVYYSRYAIHEKRSIWKRIGDAITYAVTSVLRHIYLIISSILFLDSWLLQSSDGAIGKKKKGLLITLLVLLPLLLVGGTYYYLDKPAPIPKLPQLNFNINLDQIVDPQLLENIKLRSIEQYNSALNVSSDYLLYLKAVVQDSADGAKKILTDNYNKIVQ